MKKKKKEKENWKYNWFNHEKTPNGHKMFKTVHLFRRRLLPSCTKLILSSN